jgi:DNA-3-methyladenine glycosylase I
LIAAKGSLASYFWGFADPSDQPPLEIPSTTETSVGLAKDLKKKGFTFVGPTTVYAFMQAMGLVNDHLAGCHVRGVCSTERSNVLASLG